MTGQLTETQIFQIDGKNRFDFLSTSDGESVFGATLNITTFVKDQSLCVMDTSPNLMLTPPHLSLLPWGISSNFDSSLAYVQAMRDKSNFFR